MDTENTNAINEFVNDSLHSAEERLHLLEKDAKKVLKVVKSRQRAEEVRVGKLLANLRKTVRKTSQEWSKVASEVLEELQTLLAGLQTRILNAAGIASTTEVEAISSELEKIARKVDRLVKAQGKSGNAKGFAARA